MKNSKVFFTILAILFLILVIGIIIYTNEMSKKIKNNIMVTDPVTGRLVHLDCTKQINCGYCKSVKIPCPQIG